VLQLTDAAHICLYSSSSIFVFAIQVIVSKLYLLINLL